MRQPKNTLSPLNDPELTATSRLIWNQYADSGLDQPWDRDRVNRLATLFNITLQELGSACCIDWATMKAWYLKNEFPPHACLHFVKLVTLWKRLTMKHDAPLGPEDLVWARILLGAGPKKKEAA